MSLNFYADSGLTLRMTAASPKRFLFPDTGGSKTSQLWLGDPYTSECATQANSGANTLDLTDTSEFLTASEIAGTSGGVGTAISGSQVFTYTGKSQSALTGVSGITSTIHVGDIVKPKITYHGVNGANISIFPTGSDLLNFGIKVAVGSTPTLSFPGLPAIFSNTSIVIGVENAVEVFMSVACPAGSDAEFTNFGLQANNLFKRDDNDTTAFSATEGTYAPLGDCYINRHEEDLPLPIRILPVNRQVQADSPGWIVGEYRWRGNNDRNATALVPTHWDIDPNSVGLEKFIAGFGDGDDLDPVELVAQGDSIFMELERGEYFTGANRYYLGADQTLEFLQSSLAAANEDGTVTLHLQGTPRPNAPVFVGTWVLDNQGYYEKSIDYKLISTLKNPDGTDRTDLPDTYCTLDRKTNILTLNKSMGHPLVFLGTVSGQDNDYFDIPVYPVDNIDTVFVNRGANDLDVFATTWTFDREQGTLIVPNIPGTLAGQAVYAFCSPAIAVQYDTGPDDTRVINNVDLNPAFSGLPGGFFYLQHRRQKPSSLVLSCDKPQIPIPATQASIIGLVAFGPVYFENDFALLTVTANSPVAGETIPNAKLDVIVDPETFTGTINYLDPLTQTVTVITGGDGTANMIFVPSGGFGVWIPTTAASGSLGGVATTNIANDSLVLPEAVPLGQIWDPQESWLVTTYTVLNDDPLFGMVGGDPSLGEIPYQTSGTPGEEDYKTNGERRAWRAGNQSFGNLVLPIDAFDADGNSYTSSDFNGDVKKLVYSTALPTMTGEVSDVGAYFVTFVQRVLIKMQLENSNVFSNSILLQMATPDLIVEDPWLILNDQIQGRLEQFRLGFVRRS